MGDLSMYALMKIERPYEVAEWPALLAHMPLYECFGVSEA